MEVQKPVVQHKVVQSTSSRSGDSNLCRCGKFWLMLYIDIIDTSSILPFEESRRLSRKKSLLGSNVAL